MPIYEYRCASCGHQFEEIQQFSDPDPNNCPDCGHEQISRLVSQSNFSLKGGGWFDDGYAGDPTATDEQGGEAADGFDDDDSGEEAAAE